MDDTAMYEYLNGGHCNIRIFKWMILQYTKEYLNADTAIYEGNHEKKNEFTIQHVFTEVRFLLILIGMGVNLTPT